MNVINMDRVLSVGKIVVTLQWGRLVKLRPSVIWAIKLLQMQMLYFNGEKGGMSTLPINGSGTVRRIEALQWGKTKGISTLHLGNVKSLVVTP